MAITDAIAGLFGWRRVVVYDHSVVAATVQGLSPTDLYRRQPALRAVVSFLADNVAGVPIKCYVREGDTDRPRDTTSALALLLARPGDGMTTFELMRATVSDLKLWGQSLWYVHADADSQSGYAIRYVPWSWVTHKETWSGFEPTEYRVTNPYNGVSADLPATDCVRFFSYHPRGVMDASSPIESLKEVLSEQISAWEFRNGVWRNGGRVQQWISRPAGADWSPEARKRWAKSWKERFSGKDGTDTGGTPILEDGMRLETTQLNAREAQWQEATRLAREDVAAVYHVNPSQIWHSESQTYASAKDNARALYADTLANDFALIEQRINAVLVPMLGMDPARHYCEFDLSSKLAASFEEQAGVLQSSVGGPYMTRNEARARMNMPALPGGDELIVPLNVTEGGLASPNDTDPTKARPALDVRVEPVAKGGGAAPFGDVAAGHDAKLAVTLLKTSSEPPEDSVAEIEGVLRRLLERQARRVFADLRAGEAASKSRKAADDYPWWWDMLRWDRELGDDLEPLFRKLCDLRGMSAMADIEEPASAWDSGRTANFVHAMAERRAHLFNEGTMRALAGNMLEFDVGDPEAVTRAERSFLDHAANRATRGALTFATAVCGFATKEAVRQVYPRDTDTVRRTKTWRHHGSKDPRSAHAAMDGETVGLDERFSNGADYPGDLGLPAEETVNCHCTIDVGVERRADFSFATDGRVRYEGATEADLPEGAIQAMADFTDGFSGRYPALAGADGSIPLGLSGVTVCDAASMAEEAGLPVEDVADAVGMFIKTADGSANAGIYLNAELLAGVSLEQALSDFRHEYGHYVGWFIERSGSGRAEGMVREVLEKLTWDASNVARDVTGALIIGDLSEYAGKSWINGLPGEVFAEAFRIWQEGGDSRIAAILGPMIDAALKGVV